MVKLQISFLDFTSRVFIQIIFKTATGEWQSVQLQESVSTVTTPTTSVAPAITSPSASAKKPGGKKERTLAKIAPAGGMITFNASQLPSAAQAVQTISINGVQVQGVPVTITNTGGERPRGLRPSLPHAGLRAA